MLALMRTLMTATTVSLALLAATPAMADPLDDAREAWAEAVAQAGPESPDALIAEWDLALMLDNAGQLAEAETHWRHMAAVAEPLGEDSSLLAQVRLRLAMNRVQQDGYEEAIALAEAGLPVMLAEVGPDDEIVSLGRMTLATGYMMLGRYAEAEAPARAAFESALARNGGQGAAPYAMMLRQIYSALGRESDAREVMALADPAQAEYSSRQHHLTVLRESGAWADLVIAARMYADEWRAKPNDGLAAMLAEEADLDRVLALSELARIGAPVDFAEAETAVDGVIAARRARAQDWSLSRALAAKSSLYATWPGHEDYTVAAQWRGEALSAIEADVGQDHPAALAARLVYGMLLLQTDPVAAAPVLATYYDAAREGRVRADDWATAAVLLSDVLAETDEPAMAYAMLSDAADGLRAYAMAPERAADSRQTLDSNALVFRSQVGLAWTLAHTP